jgi:hypothetical protein
MKSAITKRHNSLKMVAKWWSESNISSTINALNLMKDVTVTNDFFTNAFIRDDISKIPLSLDHAIGIIPHIKNLIGSKYEQYCKTGCKTGMVMLKLMSEKIFMIKSSFAGPEKDEKLKKCEQIMDLFNAIYKSQNFAKLLKKTSSPELCKIANSLFTDLEFFLKSFKKI